MSKHCRDVTGDLCARYRRLKSLRSFTSSSQGTEKCNPEISGRTWKKTIDPEPWLLPGLLDDITIEHILTKVPWKTLNILSVVSRGWQRMIHARVAYATRMRKGSTNIVLVDFTNRYAKCPHAMPTGSVWGHESLSHCCVYDTTDRAWHALPQLPSCGQQWVLVPGCAMLDGVIYRLARGNLETTLYRLDLAASELSWKRSTMSHGNMGYSRFELVVNDGVLYVILGSKIYVPSNLPNQWTFITNIGGIKNSSIRIKNCVENLASVNGEMFCKTQQDPMYHIYNPHGDVWRAVKPRLPLSYKRNEGQNWVVVAETLYRVSLFMVHLYDVTSNSWVLVQNCNRTFLDDEQVLDPQISYQFQLQQTVVVEDELVVRFRKLGSSSSQGLGVVDCKSTGFLQKGVELVWRLLPGQSSAGLSWAGLSNSMCTGKL